VATFPTEGLSRRSRRSLRRSIALAVPIFTPLRFVGVSVVVDKLIEDEALSRLSNFLTFINALAPRFAMGMVEGLSK